MSGRPTPAPCRFLKALRSTGLQFAAVATGASFNTTGSPFVTINQTINNGQIVGGALIVADPNAQTVNIFNSAFAFSGAVNNTPDIQITGFVKPVATFSDIDSKKLFVVDQGSNTVFAFNTATLLATQSAASAVSAITGFSSPSSVTVDQGSNIGGSALDNLIVADTGNHRIFEMNNVALNLPAGASTVNGLTALGVNVAVVYSAITPIVAGSAGNFNLVSPIIVVSDSTVVATASRFPSAELFIVDAGTGFIQMWRPGPEWPPWSHRPRRYRDGA